MNEQTKNQRTIPTTEEFKKSIIEGKATAMNDIVYMYLQSVSNRKPTESHRYVVKSELNIKAITGKSGVLRISRQTYYNKIADLKAAGFIEEDENYYILKNSNSYFLLPNDTIVYLLNNGLNEGMFKLIAWLGNRNKIMKGNVIFSQNVLIEEVLGENNKSAPQHRRVKDNLDMLHRLGLIRCIKQETAKGNEVYKMIAFSTEIGGLDEIAWDGKMFRG